MIQQKVLKFIIQNPDWISKTSNLFFTDDCKRIKAIADLQYQKRKMTSIMHVRHVLSQNQGYEDLLNQLDQLERVETIDVPLFLDLRDELRQEAKTRILNTVAKNPITDPKQYQTLLKDLNDLERDEVVPKLNRAIPFTDWSQHIAPHTQTVDSGLDFLKDTGTDTKLGDVINLIAASGNFKTGAMTFITMHQLSMTRNVLFFSMEETAQSLLARIGCGLLKKTPHQYSQLGVTDLEKEYQGKVLGNLDVISGEVVYIEELADTIKECEEARGYKYDWIVIDYSAQIEVKTALKTSREDQNIAKIFRELKLIALKADNPKIIMTALQSNRSGYGKKSPGPENAASSMGSVHAADLMLSLKYAANPNAEQRLKPADELAKDVKGFVKVTVVKKRTGTVAVGSSAIYSHLASGTINRVNKEDEDNADLWDNLFEIPETQSNNRF